MDSLVPSRWGRPLESYVVEYGMDGAIVDLLSAVNMNDLDHDSEIEKISSVSTNDWQGLNRVTISAIKKLLRLPYSPHTYPKLASPALIHGCIKLMSTIKISNRTSPFSYELGYACFRLVTACIGACLLHNTGTPAFVERSAELRPAFVTPVVEGIISHSGGRDRQDYNCVLGWSSCPTHADHQVQVIVSLSDTRLLMEMLYDDRHLFLKALRSTHSPGLSAVVFLIWRYVNYQRFLQGPTAANKLIQPLYDILNRCWLVSTVDQHAAFFYMHQWDKDLWTVWDDTSVIKVTPEDSREIVGAFTDHITQMSLEPDLSMSLFHLSHALSFLGGRILPSSEDLLGPFISAFIERLWFAVAHQELTNIPLAEAMGTMFSWIKAILKRLHHTWEIDPIAVMRIIDAVVDADLLLLVGRTIFLVGTELPTSKDSPGFMANFKVLHGTRELFLDISNLAPRQLIETRFKSCQPAWWKVYRHFQFMNLVVDPGAITPHGNRWGFYALCSETWNNIIDSISAPSDIKGRQMVACHYSRCPDPGILGGAEYSCSWCWRVKYCSPRCQVMDWVDQNVTRAHRILCARYRSGGATVLRDLQQFEFTGGAFG
ncbi:MYND finger protein [Rhizoctonia solani 123E]|uniref:MYND finger protein n=1 Tax=Rhizoctonia solani 123E TaxID=1423351 RepID=A0A074SGQ8_9AGAM|nr:MYND finger protein [Rhizoctonia solani 123E]